MKQNNQRYAFQTKEEEEKEEDDDDDYDDDDDDDDDAAEEEEEGEEDADTWHSPAMWTFFILVVAVSSVKSDLDRVKRAPPVLVKSQDEAKFAESIPRGQLDESVLKKQPKDAVAGVGMGGQGGFQPQPMLNQDQPRLNQDQPNMIRQPVIKKPIGDNEHGAGRGDWKPENPAFNAAGAIGSNKKQVMGKKKEHMKISASAECSDDVRRFCSEEINNFQILDCLQDNERYSYLQIFAIMFSVFQTDNKVSHECHNFLWQYKLKLTTDLRFDQASNDECAPELSKIADCNQLERGKGLIIPCLIEHFDEITSRPCSNFINKMASIVFSDYRLMESFMADCKNDVIQLHCGRLDGAAEDDGAVHSQGYTVSCLNGHRKLLSKKCKKALLHVAELQADDYHLDRPLYYACKGDRVSLCPDVAAGEGAIFKCLYRHLGDKRLTEMCRTKLEQREQLVAEDVKVDSAFYDACAQDIKKNRCGAPSNEDNSEEDLSRSTVLLCLEKVQSEGKKVQAKCLQEMFELRSELMQDYKISPELVSACEGEIKEFCDGGLELDGATIECLMKEAQDKRNAADSFGSACKAQIQQLLVVANPGEDIRLDPPLHRACGEVAKTLCSSFKPGKGDVMTCLFDNMDHEDMTEECEEKLLEIQYFAVRDFRLDHHLFKKCHADAKKLCNSDGFDDPKAMIPEQGPLIFSCLHRHLNSDSASDKKPSRPCAHEIKRVLRERSHRVKLMPEIEAACLSDLGDMCSDEEEISQVGGELECLQENLEQLRPACRAAVGNFTEEEMGDVELDRILMKACTPMIKRFCEDLLHNDAMPDEVLECLIEHKAHNDMDEKCAVGIEHHQIVSLKDFRFNHKFREACQSSVEKYCKNKRTKYEVVACLSEHVRNDTLMEHEQRVNKRCQKQLRFELLQRGESIKLDPELEKACKTDINKFCSSDRDGGGEIIECLHKHKKRLTDKCHKLVFQREKDDAIFGDYTVLHVCKKMIKKHCNLNSDEPTLLDCLNEHKDDVNFDEPCRKIVQRREVEQAQDIRLNPHLQKACRLDIPKYCGEVYDRRHEDGELEGQVIDCLKMHYISKQKPLSRDCEHEIQSRIKEAALDINKNPVVMKYCKADIKRNCIEEISNVRKMSIGVQGEDIEDDETEEYETAGTGRVIECLKRSFSKLKNMQCKKEIGYMIAESRVDVHVDPLLHATCQKDILTLCDAIQQGQGRQMACLLSYLESNPDRMTKTCREMMQRRKDLWEYAAQVAPMESFSEMIDQMNISPARNYFFAVIFTVIGLIFIFGLTCGRVTKRVRAEIKNK
ncbi:Golgi apparatus protein 1 [Elysia marginata]|uniref:Golgi apparatus protein 1 n=1 Tax=Elysia marginata TaxID=1093978 RepID=A0AAV4I8P8_9GAST|nr:Golgi apparatus protein 1 [Elysia marginata]